MGSRHSRKRFINALAVVATLSGPGGSTLRLFDMLTGHLTLEKLLHDPASGHVSEPHHVGKHVTFDTDATSIYALHNGYTVVKIDVTTKDIIWTWAAPDQTCVSRSGHLQRYSYGNYSSLTIYSHIVVTSDTAYVVGLSKSFADYTLHIAALDSSTGALLGERPIPSAIKDFSSYLPLSAPISASKIPHVLWLENGLMKSFPLTLDVKATALWLQKKGSEAAFATLTDVGLSGQGYTVVIEDDGTEHLIGIDGTGVKEFWELKPGNKEERSESLWAGGVDDGGDLFVSRIYWANAVQVGETLLSSVDGSDACPAENEGGNIQDWRCHTSGQRVVDALSFQHRRTRSHQPCMSIYALDIEQYSLRLRRDSFPTRPQTLPQSF